MMLKYITVIRKVLQDIYIKFLGTKTQLFVINCFYDTLNFGHLITKRFLKNVFIHAFLDKFFEKFSLCVVNGGFSN